MTDTKRWLPSRHFVVALVTLVVLVSAGGILLTHHGTVPQLPAPTPASTAEAVARSAETLDSDNDGLKDWEETLWETNPENSDSDGDGTTDGQEVAENRDPTKAGPDDTYVFSPTDSSVHPSTSSTQEFSETGIISQILLSEYVAAAQESGALTPESVAMVADRTAEQARLFLEGIETSPLDLSVMSDLSVTQDSSSPALKTYGNALGSILSQQPSPEENEWSVFLKFIRGQDIATMRELAPVAHRYEVMADELKTMTVPERIAEAHLSFLNSVEETARALRHMTIVGADSVADAQIITNYLSAIQQMGVAFKQISEVLQNEAIVFNSSEPGYLILNIR